MARLGFYFDMRRCIGCKACQVACKDKNNLGDGTFFRRVISFTTQTNNITSLRNYSAACNHCEAPACVAACPTGATHKAKDGTVAQHRSSCIGCGACIWSCPYGAPSFNSQDGASHKCDACADLRVAGKNPACVDACMTHCLRFGDLDELEKEFGPGTVRQIIILPDADQTNPSLLIYDR